MTTIDFSVCRRETPLACRSLAQWVVEGAIRGALAGLVCPSVMAAMVGLISRNALAGVEFGVMGTLVGLVLGPLFGIVVATARLVTADVAPVASMPGLAPLSRPSFVSLAGVP